MKTSLTTIEPPSETGPSPGPVLVLFITVPAHPVYEIYFPADNFIGTELLTRTLNVALKNAGHEIELPGYGPLNQGVFFTQASDAYALAKVVWDELATMPLQDFAAIYRHDAREGILRSLFPAMAKDINLGELDKMTAPSSAQVARLVAKFKEIARDMTKDRPPQAPPEAPPETPPEGAN